MNKIFATLLVFFSISNLFAISDCDADFDWEISGYNITVLDNSDSDLGEIISWYYTIDGEFVSDDPDFEYTFTEPGLFVICLVVETSGGCEDDRCKNVLIVEDGVDCFVDFNFEVDGMTVEFGAETDPEDFISIFWSFGDGSGSYDAEPEHTYGSDGTYEVCATVVSLDSCIATACDVVEITDGAEGCEGMIAVWTIDDLNVHFSAFAFPDDEVVEYTIDFGDGTEYFESGSSDPIDPWHEYAEPGMYDVCLSIETETGCTDETCITVSVGDSTGFFCTASYDFELDGTTVFFDAITTPGPGDVDSYFWDFGDGSFGDGNDPEHEYEPGEYLVCLTVTFAGGCVAEYCNEIVVGLEGDCVASLVVWSVDGTGVHFYGSVEPDFDIVTYTFEYGDGTSEEFIGSSAGADPWHEYDSDGFYEVCLSIETGSGCTDETCIEIFVGDSIGVDCFASFDYEIDGTTVFFEAETDPGPGDVIAYDWNFGDGTYTGGMDTIHEYEPGEYLVCLTVTFASGCVAEYCEEIVVLGAGDACEAFFNITSITPDGDGWVVHFNNESDVIGGDIGSVLWDFGDGTYADSYDAEHYFELDSIYNVCVTITSADSACTDTYCFTLILGDVGTGGDCEASFEYELSGGFGSFFSTSDAASDIIAWAWDFGDGTYGFGEDIEHSFDEGVFEVCLAIVTADSCVDSYCATIIIGDSSLPCEAYFIVSSITETGDGWVVEYYNMSGDDYEGNAWTFGDGGTSDGANPDHLYTEEGYYTVCLTIGIAGTDCYDQYCKDIFIGDCFDESLIDTLFECTEVYDPVCGCDGVTYSNECYATYYGGVLSWTDGECGATGVEEEVIMGAIVIMPNPANSIFTTEINLVKSQYMQIVLMDMSGRLVQNIFTGEMPIGIHQITTDVHSLQAGLYFLQLNDGENVRTEKLILMK